MAATYEAEGLALNATEVVYVDPLVEVSAAPFSGVDCHDVVSHRTSSNQES